MAKKCKDCVEYIECVKYWKQVGLDLNPDALDCTSYKSTPKKKRDRVVKGWYCYKCNQATVGRVGMCVEATIPCTIHIKAEDWEKIKG